MNMNNVFKKILIATSLITLAFSSLAFAAVNNNSQVEKEKVTITVTSDIEIVKRAFNPDAQKGSGNEFIETKISVSDLKNGDAVFCEKDENGKVQGFVLPESVAPYKVQIIPKMDNEEKVKEAEELYTKLSEKGIGAILDDRNLNSIGAKIKDCKVLGTPYMAVLGDKVEEGKVERVKKMEDNKQ